MRNCKCRDTITKKQVEYLGRLAELTVEAALGGKNSLSYRVLFRSCCDNLDDDFEEVFGTTELYELKPCSLTRRLLSLRSGFPMTSLWRSAPTLKPNSRNSAISS